MQIEEPGHIYLLQMYSPSGEPVEYLHARLEFFKKVGENFLGNQPPEHLGTNCQEVLRGLIDRVKYLNGQKPCAENMRILFHLRSALLQFEQRAARLKNILFFERQDTVEEYTLEGLEDKTPCPHCGHVFLHTHAATGA